MEGDTDIARKIIKLSQGIPGGVVGNEKIYKHVCGMQRFSERWWRGLKAHLQNIAFNSDIPVEFEGQHYRIVPYSPMLRSKYNFPQGNRYIAGFQVFSV